MAKTKPLAAAGLDQCGAAGRDGASLLAAAKRAATLARGGWGAHLLDPASIRQIERDDSV
jgi:hypothetical protein